MSQTCIIFVLYGAHDMIKGTEDREIWFTFCLQLTTSALKPLVLGVFLFLLLASFFKNLSPTQFSVYRLN